MARIRTLAGRFVLFIKASEGRGPWARATRSILAYCATAKRRAKFAAYWVIGIGAPFAAGAEPSGIAKAFEDPQLYITAPFRWDQQDWLYVGAALAAIGVSHEFDRKLRADFATASNTPLNGGKDKNSLRDALPTVAIIAGTGLGALFYRDSDGYQETWALLEAGILSSVAGEAITFAAGRERPDATTSPNRWRQGGDSFPSLHADAAFAVGTVFAESGSDDYRWIRRIIGYGVAAGTAYIRLHEEVHWVSDTVAGAALGIATARFVLNRQESKDRVALQFQPIKGGWMISYSAHTR